MPYVTLRYERAKLYEEVEVWAEAVTKVAKRYGISDVALRKICRKLAVPLPPLGYWAKLAAGKKLPTPRLSTHSGPDVSGDINPPDSEDQREAPPESFTVLLARTSVFEFDAGVSSAVV